MEEVIRQEAAMFRARREFDREDNNIEEIEHNLAIRQGSQRLKAAILEARG